MIIYYILLLVISGFGIICFWNGTTQKANKIFVIGSFFFIFILQALRKESVGVDVPTYVQAFHKIRELPWDECRLYDWEPLFAYLNKLVGTYTNSYSVFLSIVSVIILLGFGYFIYQNSSNTFWPVFLFITLDHMFVSMYSLRQYCAIAISINIYTILRKGTSVKAYIKAVTLLIIAMMFHTTAIICVLFIAVFMLGKISKNRILLFALTGLLATFFFDHAVELFLEIFPRYAYYRDSNLSIFQGAEIRNIDFIYDVVKLLSLFIMWKFNYKEDENQSILKLILLSSIAVIISLLVVKVKIVWRFTFYFDAFLILLLPKIIDKIKFHRGAAYAGLYIFGILYFSYIMLLNGGKCVPYLFFWT